VLPWQVALADHLVRAIPGFCQPVSSLSHLVAASAALVGAVPLIRLGRGSTVRVAAVAIYACCLVTTLIVSGTYHAMAWHSSARDVMQRFDYYAIWLLIAGTFTAVHGVMCRGFWRTGVLAFTWGYAICGVLLQIFWFNVFSGVWGLVLYLGLGWVGATSVIKLGRQIGYRAVRPIWYAGIVYSTGAVLEACAPPMLVRHWVGPHEIFHVAVIVGATLHWLFIRDLLIKHAPGVANAVAVPVAIPVPAVAGSG
jgi:hemolysin III